MEARFGFGFLVRTDIDRLRDDVKRPALGLLVQLSDIFSDHTDTH